MEEDIKHVSHNINISQDNTDMANKGQNGNLKKNDNPYPFYSLNMIKEILIKNVDNNNELINKIIRYEGVIELEEYPEGQNNH